MNTLKLPIFPEDEFSVNGVFFTKKHLRKALLFLFPELCERANFKTKFNNASGELERYYAWHGVISKVNELGEAQKVVDLLMENNDVEG